MNILLSSTLLGTTRKSIPAWFSKYRRRGDLEAKISKGAMVVFSITNALSNESDFDKDCKHNRPSGYKDRGLCRVSLGNGIIRFIDLDIKYKTLDDMLKII
jgi:hypothetical protein